MELILIIVFISTTAIDQAYSDREVLEPIGLMYRQDSRYFYFPGDGNEKVYIIDAKEPVTMSALTGAENTYWLYTRRNLKIPQMLKIHNKESVNNSNFNSSHPTVFIVHGWKGSANNTSSAVLTSAFLENDDVNVIVIDYKEDADLMYILAVIAAPQVGDGLGQFINWLVTMGLSLNKTHLVGFSLGAHIAGIAGRYNSGKIRRITGLDPAGPLWYENKNRMRDTDAHYVEVIHTNMLLFGYLGKLGRADFFPNGGIFMPGCLLNSCSHSRSIYYMAESVKFNDLNANECKDMYQVEADMCDGPLYPMGNSDLTKKRGGLFRVDANSYNETC